MREAVALPGAGTPRSPVRVVLQGELSERRLHVVGAGAALKPQRPKWVHRRVAARVLECEPPCVYCGLAGYPTVSLSEFQADRGSGWSVWPVGRSCGKLRPPQDAGGRSTYLHSFSSAHALERALLGLGAALEVEARVGRFLLSSYPTEL